MWSSSNMHSFVGKYRSQGLVFLPMTYNFSTSYSNCLKVGMKIGTIMVKGKFKQSMFYFSCLLDEVITKCQNCKKNA